MADHADELAEAALKAGAGVIADAVRANIETLPERTGRTKRGLQKGLGVTPVRNRNGTWDIKVGFDGYNEGGRPNQLMAALFESGSSKLKKHPIVRPAVTKAKDEAVQAMVDAADQKINELGG